VEASEEFAPAFRQVCKRKHKPCWNFTG
jgi:hypothetical protein